MKIDFKEFLMLIFGENNASKGDIVLKLYKYYYLYEELLEKYEKLNEDHNKVKLEYSEIVIEAGINKVRELELNKRNRKGR